MAYCTETDIKLEFKNIVWDTSGGIAAATVTKFCEEDSSIIDAYVAFKYILPITGTASLSICKRINIALTSYRVKTILHVKNIDVLSQKEGLKDEYEWAMQFLMDIKNGDAILPDSPVSGTSQTTDRVFYKASAQIFDKGKEQW